jgi:hypothetical protein
MLPTEQIEERRDGFNAVVPECAARGKEEQDRQDSQLARGCHHRIRPISSIAQRLGFKLSLRSKIRYHTRPEESAQSTTRYPSYNSPDPDQRTRHVDSLNDPESSRLHERKQDIRHMMSRQDSVRIDPCSLWRTSQDYLSEQRCQSNER